MKSYRGAILALLACLGIVAGSAQSPTNSYQIAPAPPWVLPPRPAPTDSLPTNSLGVVYLNGDFQIDLASQSTYRRYSKRILSENGVQNESQIRFRFEPSHESLVIHKVELRRNGTSQNRLIREKLRVLEEENDSYRHIYNGAVAVLAILEDVRVGDEIDFSYTVRGFNPIFGDRWSGFASIDFSVPLLENRIRVVSPQARPPLRYKLFGRDDPPQVTEGDGSREYVWLFRDLRPVQLEDRLPDWFSGYDIIQFSEYKDWSEVRDWALPLYKTNAAAPAELTEVAERIKRENKTPHAQALAALRFVQDEIRYLGIEIGENSHQPQTPASVLSRRFGDCKDKTVLLCTLLQLLGINSHAALVNTYLDEKVSERLPSPLVFNHVIVRAILNNKSLWLDPTLTHQRGTVSDCSIDFYRRALVVAEDSTDLTAIPREDLTLPTKIVNETLTVHAYDGPGELTVETIYTGDLANSMRSTFADYSLEELQKDYLNYYLRRYASVTNTAPVKILDDTAANRLTVIETYRLKNPWPDYQDKKAIFYTSFEGSAVTESARHPETYERTMPLELQFPWYVKHVVSIHLPDENAFEDESKEIEDEFQRFRYEADADKTNFVLSFEYKTLRDSVPAEKISDYIKNLDEVHETCSYTASFPKTGAKDILSRVNWPILGLTVAALLIMGFGAFKFYQWNPNAHSQIPPQLPAHPHLVGLRGWLFLVGFGLVVAPIRIVRTLVENFSTFAPYSWQYLTSPDSEAYHALWAPFIITELLGNLCLLVLVCLALVLFFQRRSTFPGLYISFLIFNAVFIITDTFAMFLIPALAKEIGVSEFRDATRAVLGGLIWISYMFKSRRVKATFTR